MLLVKVIFYVAAILGGAFVLWVIYEIFRYSTGKMTAEELDIMDKFAKERKLAKAAKKKAKAQRKRRRSSGSGLPWIIEQTFWW